MIKPKATLNRFSIAVAAAASCAPALAKVSANVALTSDYVFRGFSQTQGDPAIQGGFDFAHDSGLYAGVWASNVESDPAAPVNYDGANLETDLYLGWAGTFHGVAIDTGLLRYQYPGTNTAANNTDEIHICAGLRSGGGVHQRDAVLQPGLLWCR